MDRLTEKEVNEWLRQPQPKIKIFLVHETPLQSWLNDAGTFLMIACVIGLGWFLDSSAMQWVGAIMAFLIMFGWSSKRRDHFTPQEAADRLRREFGVVGRELGE